VITDGSDGALRPGYEQRRDHGCIVTWRTADGQLRSRHAPGLVLEALREIVVGIPPGCTVLSISTPASILRDLSGSPRGYGGSRLHERVDAYAVERPLLGKVHRPDLLPAHARGRLS